MPVRSYQMATGVLSDNDALGIVAYILKFNGYPSGAAPLVVLAHAGAELVGGVIGLLHWRWLYVRQLWVADGWRARGVRWRRCCSSGRRAPGRPNWRGRLRPSSSAIRIGWRDST